MQNSHFHEQYSANPQIIRQVHAKITHCPSFLLKQTTSHTTNQLLNSPPQSTFSQLNVPRLSINRKKSKSHHSDQNKRQKMESTRSQEDSSRSSIKKQDWQLNGIKQKKNVDCSGGTYVGVKQYENVEGNPIKINIRNTMGNQKCPRIQVRKMSANLKFLNDKVLFPYMSFDRKFQQKTSLSARLCDSPRGSTGSDYFDKKMQIQDFQIIKDIGKGKTSQVYLAIYKSIGMVVALKKISKQLIKRENLKQYVLREIKIHSHIKHDNIIGLHGYFFDTKNVYLVLEFMGNSQSLYKMAKSRKTLTEKQTQRIIADVCKAVKYLHSQNIIHRDLKLQNTLLSNGVAKISDLGCSIHTFCMRKSQVGSLVYLSPQQINDNFYNEKIDIWSIGIMTFELLFGYAPFDDKIESILSKNGKFVAFDVKFPFEPKVSETSKDFICKLLAKNPNQRLCIEDVLTHGFIKDYVN